MIGKESIGLESEVRVLKIEPEAVRRFAEATGAQYNDRVPPTFVVTLRQANIPGFELPIPGMIHGEQKITFHREIQIGERLSCKRCIKDVYARSGKLGNMTFVVIETTGYDSAAELVFSSNSTLIAPIKVDVVREE
ncbi:hypothetical protein E4K67_11535 [Desulfosporosinus fructosivorans]|uniref:FAS1-like dehydratase domain-containing protein n=1 Tax=Desulfosporosinus fructosivorans TaxID=2018669 RepID=A0A4Z0R6U3_9FIRM|nr:MaoC family dehydratase N-terminal domain-containing protein [Desulfosporosinus fructosivorans]TGE38548.1 hypothetical protein E4K67_11535 [Desulfosporosinus fructosivorans]